jgi:hypothetical protein
VAVEEGHESLSTGALGRLKRGPLGKEVYEDLRLLVAKPLQNLGEVGLESEGEAVGEPDAILDEIAAGLDQAAQGAHIGMLRSQGLELVAMAEEKIESDLSVGRIVLGATWSEGPSVLGQGAGVDREYDEEVVLEQGGDDRPMGQLNADGDAFAVEADAQRRCPGLDGHWPVLEDGELIAIRAGHGEADVVLRVGPVNADQGGEVRNGLLHRDLLE